MSISRTTAKDFAISRFAKDVEEWLSIALQYVCNNDEAKLQELYDQRAQQQLEEDKNTEAWFETVGDTDWERYETIDLPTLEEIEEPFIPEVLPVTIHVAWLRAALAELGELDAVNAAVAMSGPVKQQLWDYATTVARLHPDVVAIADALNIDLDEVFELANEIRITNNS